MPAAPFQLTDFRLAGFLLSHGCAFLGTERNARGEVTFQFGPDEAGVSPEQVLTKYPGSVEYQYDAACRVMHDFTKISMKDRQR